MKTRPVICPPGEVRAILDDRQSQMRRVVKPQPYILIGTQPPEWPKEYPELCPYGVPGDRLWVRETWCVHARYDGLRPAVLPDIKYLQNGVTYMADVYNGEKSLWMGKTRPSIFMPRKHSRLTLEITNVRVERVREITYAQVIAEGLTYLLTDEQQTDGAHRAEGVEAFGNLWDKMHGKKHPWSSNPWVWCVSFKVAS